MMKNKILKSCPFCGGNGSITIDPKGVKDSMGKKWMYTVSCDRCRASTGICWTREMAIDTWNRRTSDVYRQEVKHAKWELINKNQSRCSNCGLVRNIETQVGWKFCPMCGAKFNLED